MSAPPATQRSIATVLAVKHRHRWGFFAARRYAERRGSTPLLWMICLRLECERALRSFPFITSTKEQQSNELGKRLLELEALAHEAAGQPFNVNSPKQLAEILFVKLGLPVKKKTPSGTPSTDEEVLSELALDYPLPKLLLESRQLAPLRKNQMETSTILHILRNPWGWPQVEQRQARLAAADLIEARLWQPIETAPRDGTAILVIIPNADSPKAVRWDYKRLCWIHTWDTFPFHDRNAPIYWMPIADLPARTPTT